MKALKKVTFFVALCLLAIFNTSSAVEKIWKISACRMPWGGTTAEISINGTITRDDGAIQCGSVEFEVYTKPDIDVLFQGNEVKILNLRQEFAEANIKLRMSLNKLIIDSLNKSLSTLTNGEKKNLAHLLTPEIEKVFDSRYAALKARIYQDTSNQILNDPVFLKNLAKKLKKP
jgi:hypothetical protein